MQQKLTHRLLTLDFARQARRVGPRTWCRAGQALPKLKGKLMLFFFITACAAFVLWTASMGYIVFVGTKARFDRFCKENVSDPEMDWFDELY